MFVERREDDIAVALQVMIDRPPEETREQWIARRSRELGVTTAIVGPTSRPANGRDHP